MPDINPHVLAGAGQQLSVVREADGPDGPLQPGERLDAGQLGGVPHTHQGVGRPGGEVAAAPAEFDADAVAGVSLEDVLDLQLRPGQNLYAALAVGEIEQVVVHVPADLVHLRLELLLRPHLVGPAVNEGDEVLLVAHGNGAAVGGPGDVDVLSLRVDGGHRLVRPGVPDPGDDGDEREQANTGVWSLPDCLVSTGRGQHVWLGGMPTQLVHTVTVTLEHVLLAQLVRLQAEDTDSLVVAPTGQLPPVTAPVDAVHFGAVRRHLPGLVVPLKPSLNVLHFGTDHLVGRSL